MKTDTPIPPVTGGVDVVLDDVLDVVADPFGAAALFDWNERTFTGGNAGLLAFARWSRLGRPLDGLSLLVAR